MTREHSPDLHTGDVLRWRILWSIPSNERVVLLSRFRGLFNPGVRPAIVLIGAVTVAMGGVRISVRVASVIDVLTPREIAFSTRLNDVSSFVFLLGKFW